MSASQFVTNGDEFRDACMFTEADFNRMLAPRWEIWLAKTFGKRVHGNDMGRRIDMVQWRKKLYIIHIGP